MAILVKDSFNNGTSIQTRLSGKVIFQRCTLVGQFKHGQF